MRSQLAHLKSRNGYVVQCVARMPISYECREGSFDVFSLFIDTARCLSRIFAQTERGNIRNENTSQLSRRGGCSEIGSGLFADGHIYCIRRKADLLLPDISGSF